MRRIGILGGTFDPPHIGHLIIAEEARLALNLDEVWFIPTYTPPHKDNAKSDAAHRVNMTELAVQSNPFFKLNTIETERSSTSYTVDTMQTLNETYPDYKFYFIIGADMVEYLPNWHRIEELISMVQFVGVKRPGYELKSKYDILTVDIPMINISSTMLRERLWDKQTVTYIVPDAVVAYIRREGLYGYQSGN